MSVKWFGKDIEKKVVNTAAANILKACLIVEGDAKRICPVDTGRLRSSITHEVDLFSGKVGSNVEYAAYVELGTVKMAARPYLRPALEMNKAKILRLFT